MSHQPLEVIERAVESTSNSNEIIAEANSSLPDSKEASSNMSKNQMKRQKRRDRWLETRPDRRKLEREKRKAKRKLQFQERSQLLQQSGESITGCPIISRRPTMMSESNNKFRVVIDMNFEDYMTDQEIAKSVQQVGRIYALNRHSPNPCQLFVTSLKGKILDRFSKTNTGYKNWDANCTDLDYTQLFNETYTTDRKKFVYLSGDSDENLPDVNDILKDESKIYIMGGLVDHNRHKNLCHKMASEIGIATARLPIKEHVDLCHRSILSTVTVYEILLKVLGEHKQWPEALLESIPKRKIAAPSRVDDDSNKQESTVSVDPEEQCGAIKNNDEL